MEWFGFSDFRVSQVAVCFWPIVQTLNFTFIPERNRIVFVSVISTIWTSFLAYIKYLEESNEDVLLGGRLRLASPADRQLHARP